MARSSRANALAADSGARGTEKPFSTTNSPKRPGSERQHCGRPIALTGQPLEAYDLPIRVRPSFHGAF